MQNSLFSLSSIWNLKFRMQQQIVRAMKEMAYSTIYRQDILFIQVYVLQSLFCKGKF